MSSAAEIGGNPVDGSGFPGDVPALRTALVNQRKYTLALYADLPPAYWEPARFPYLPIVNPPLWELAHIAWFAEFFALRWRSDDVMGFNTPSIFPDVDSLFDSQAVAHPARWTNRYPEKATCFRYMEESLEAVLDALDAGESADLQGYQLAIAHEDMHAEALTMTLVTLGLPVPVFVPGRVTVAGECRDLNFDCGNIELGASARSFRFDNEMPFFRQEIAPFSIASKPVSAREFAGFVESPDYHDDRNWSEEGRKWRLLGGRSRCGEPNELAAMHVSFFEADAWCRWAGRRLPTESEWEFAATHAPGFQASAGHVWEWCASVFRPFPGFSPGRYRDYSAPWFHTHQVLKGGSFATQGRLKYPQYRNFYTPDRQDMFCGFRTCAVR